MDSILIERDDCYIVEYTTSYSEKRMAFIYFKATHWLIEVYDLFLNVMYSSNRHAAYKG